VPANPPVVTIHDRSVLPMPFTPHSATMGPIAKSTRKGKNVPDISQVYGEGKPPMPAVDQPTVIFIINDSLKIGDDVVYLATRGSWVIGEETREQAVYALGVKHGVVRGAYRIDRWHLVSPKRWTFEGVAAPELDVVGKSAAPKRAQG